MLTKAIVLHALLLLKVANTLSKNNSLWHNIFSTFAGRIAFGTKGFEPMTSCSQNRRATKLRYVPKKDFKMQFNLFMHHSKEVIDPSYGGMHHFIYKMIDWGYTPMHHPFSSPKVTYRSFFRRIHHLRHFC